jgi:hypothetical protein
MAKKAYIYKPGSFLRVRLADGSFGYGRMLEPPPIDAFYEYRTEKPDTDLGQIASKPILFKVGVRHSDLDSWELIGWRELEEPCTIFDSAGNSRSAEPHECIGLERMAVWEQHHVEERLLDTFMGRPNETVEHLKVRLR